MNKKNFGKKQSGIYCLMKKILINFKKIISYFSINFAIIMAINKLKLKIIYETI